MTSRQRLLAALDSQPLDRPPLWIMRQAGRYLPEYRELKARHSFVQMVRTPELATEVTLQPLRRFALDAAILFSDILVVPEALGQPYHFREQGGIGMEYAVRTPAQVAGMDPTRVAERLDYMAQALRLIRREIGDTKALLGFAGSPWTLATYMIEGGSSEGFAAVHQMRAEQPALLEALLERLAQAVAGLLKLQLAAGADAVQIFDSWAAACPDAAYEQLSLRWIRQIIAELPPRTPVILYAKGVSHRLQALGASGARCLSLDWTLDLAAARRALPPQVAVQGNLDPDLMTGAPGPAVAATQALLEAMRPLPGHVFNLGHGITPEARIETVQAVVDTVVG